MIKLYQRINLFHLALSLLCALTIIFGCGLQSPAKEILLPVSSGAISIPHWELAHYNRPIKAMALSADGKEGWAIGGEGLVVQYDGNAWRVDEPASRLGKDDLASIWLSADGKTGWAVGYGGTVLQLQRGVWRQLRIPEERRGFRSVISSEQENKACMVTDHLNVWCHENGGFHLTSHNTDYKEEFPTQPLPDLIVWGANQEPAWALSTEWDRKFAHIYARHYENGQWTPAVQIDSKPWHGSLDSSLSVSSAWLASDQSRGWAALSDGTILKYDKGIWSVDPQASILTQERIINFSFALDGSRGWAVGDRGVVLSWDGQQWQVASRQRGLPRVQLGATWLSQDGRGLALTETGSASLTLRGGRWSTQPSIEKLTGSDLETVWCGDDSANTWAHGSAKDATEILRLTGQGWKVVKIIPDPPRLKTPPHYGLDIPTIALSADGRIGWAINSDGNLLHYNGAAWQPWTGIGSDLVGQNLKSIYISAAGSLGAATTEESRLFIYGQGRWERQPLALLGGKIRSLWLNKTNLEGWAIGHSGQLLRFQDGRWAKDVEALSHDVHIIYILPTETGEESLAVGSNAEIYRFQQGEWRLAPTFNGLGAILGKKPDIWVSSDQKDGWMAGGPIAITGFIRGEWVRDLQASRPYRVSSICLAPDQKSGWAVGFRGLILRYAPKPIGNAEWWPKKGAKLEELRGVYRLKFKNDLKPGELPKVRLVEDEAGSEGIALALTDYEIRPVQGRPREFLLELKRNASRLAERQEGVRHKLRIEAHFAHASLPVIGVFETEPFYLQGRPLWQITLFSAIGIIGANLLLAILAIRSVPIRKLILNPFDSAFMERLLRYFPAYLFIRFISPLKLAMFHDYRKNLAVSSVLPWKGRRYVPPQVSLKLASSSKSHEADSWRAAFVELLQQSRGRVWIIQGRSGLGKTALLEKWTGLALELRKTPLLIRLRHSISPKDEAAALMGQFGNVDVEPEVAQDLLNSGGFILLLDGYNEDRKPEATLKFVRQVARKNLVVMTSQFDPGWDNVLDVARVNLEPFGRDQLLQILNAEWVDRVQSSPHLQEIAKLPFTAQLLKDFIDQRDELPNTELDIYNNTRTGLDPRMMFNLEEIAWEMFKDNQVEFPSGTKLPKEFCESAVSAGMLTRRAKVEENTYRFVHERIHRLLVASYLERQDERSLEEWHREVHPGLGRNYWTDVLDFWGQIKGSLAVQGGEGQQRAYRTFLQGVASFSPPIFAHLHIQYDRLCRSYPQLVDQSFSDWAALVLAKAVLGSSLVSSGANI